MVRRCHPEGPKLDAYATSEYARWQPAMPDAAPIQANAPACSTNSTSDSCPTPSSESILDQNPPREL